MPRCLTETCGRFLAKGIGTDMPLSSRYRLTTAGYRCIPANPM